VGVRLAGDLARSGSNPFNEFFQEEMRRPVYGCCAADRDQGLLPQGSAQFLRELPQGCEPDAAVAASGVAP
jgi:hypothetical protein